MPYTIDFLYRRTPKLRKMNALYVKINHLKLTRNKVGKPLAICQSHSTHHMLPTGRVIRAIEKTKYVTTITLLDRKYHCVCSCSCPDFVFSGAEYVLHQKGSADIEYGNGEPPLIKNIEMMPLLCKHLVALYLKIRDKL